MRPALAFRFAGTSAAAIREAAAEAMAGRPLLDGPLRLDVVFRRPRPASHYGAEGALLRERKQDPPRGPGPSALAAEVERALLGVAIRRTSQIVTVRASRLWGEAGGLAELHEA